MSGFSWAISFFSALTCADSSVVVPGRCPESTSSRFTRFRGGSAEPMPGFWATARSAADSFGQPPWTSANMRTARRRSSSG
ncbi:hypothetical protein ACIBCB_25085 [Streptomyces uncialis]|uniref:hypothetical protein n=1 Tax=Streptomyces uncialis TaxID=1048205 RepID=UPI0037AC153B